LLARDGAGHDWRSRVEEERFRADRLGVGGEGTAVLGRWTVVPVTTGVYDCVGRT